LFPEFERRLSPVMGQHHVARDKLFVDYLGKRVDIIVDPSTDVVRDAELFVGVLGASSYTYAEATFTQTLADWIGSHVRMFRFFGGVPRLVVPERPVRSRVHGAPAAASSTAHADSRGPCKSRACSTGGNSVFAQGNAGRRMRDEEAGLPIG
jgi:hypothetical protein